SGGSRRTIYLSPQGRKLDHRRVMELVKEPAVALLCGRYEGVDERLLAGRADGEGSIGDFVLSGGEIGAVALIGAVGGQVRARWATALRSLKSRSPTGCSTARSTRAPRSGRKMSGALRCRKCCSPVTTRTSGAGG